MPRLEHSYVIHLTINRGSIFFESNPLFAWISIIDSIGQLLMVSNDAAERGHASYKNKKEIGGHMGSSICIYPKLRSF